MRVSYPHPQTSPRSSPRHRGIGDGLCAPATKRRSSPPKRGPIVWCQITDSKYHAIGRPGVRDGRHASDAKDVVIARHLIARLELMRYCRFVCVCDCDHEGGPCRHG